MLCSFNLPIRNRGVSDLTRRAPGYQSQPHSRQQQLSPASSVNANPPMAAPITYAPQQAPNPHGLQNNRIPSSTPPPPHNPSLSLSPSQNGSVPSPRSAVGDPVQQGLDKERVAVLLSINSVLLQEILNLQGTGRAHLLQSSSSPLPANADMEISRKYTE